MGVFLMPFFLFVPGYALTFFFRWIHGFFERTAFSIILSVSSGVIMSVLCAAFGLPLAPSFLILLLLCIACLFFPKKKTAVLLSEWEASPKKEKRLFAFFLFISILAGVFAATPHFHYPWPIHGDEWWQVGTVQNLMEGRPINTHPYFFDELTNDKPGFSSYIAALLGAGGIDPIGGWAFLPAINVFLISFVGSLLLYAITRKGLLAGAFPVLLMAIRSNAYILGWWFFVPSTFGLFFVLAAFLSLPFWRKELSGFPFAFVLFAALFLVYAPLGIFSLIILLPFSIPYRSVLAYARKHAFLFSVVFFAMIAIVVGGIYIATTISPYREYWIVNPSLPPPVIQAFFVPRAATLHLSSGSGLFDTVPFILLFAAAAGCIGMKKEPWKRAICFGAILGVLNVLLAYVLGVSFLLFHQRAFYVLGILAAVLASSGVSLLFDEFRESRYAKRISLPRKRAVGVLFLLCFGFLLFSGYFALPNGTLLYHLVEQEDLTAMAWLVKHHEEFGNMTVVANQAVGTLITPFTRMRSKISFLTAQNAAAAINPQDILAAEEPDCGKKEESIIHLKGDLVYAKSPQSCPFLKEVYAAPRVFIYLFRKT